MQDPESLYRQAKYRLDEVHAAAARQSLAHRARTARTGNAGANRSAALPRLLKRVFGRVELAR